MRGTEKGENAAAQTNCSDGAGVLVDETEKIKDRRERVGVRLLCNRPMWRHMPGSRLAGRIKAKYRNGIMAQATNNNGKVRFG